MKRLVGDQPFSEASIGIKSVKRLRIMLAYGISFVTKPLFVALPTFLIVALHTAPDVIHALTWWMITVVGITVAPFLFIWHGVHHGRYSDHYVSNREQRLIPLAFGIGCVGIVFILLYFFHVSRPLLATVTATFATCVIATAITLYWKISFHLLAIAGAVTTMWLMFGSPFLLLSPLIIFVGWARWQVRAHTLLQAIAGTAIAVSITVITFWLFGLY